MPIKELDWFSCMAYKLNLTTIPKEAKKRLEQMQPFKNIHVASQGEDSEGIADRDTFVGKRVKHYLMVTFYNSLPEIADGAWQKRRMCP